MGSQVADPILLLSGYIYSKVALFDENNGPSDGMLVYVGAVGGVTHWVWHVQGLVRATVWLPGLPGTSSRAVLSTEGFPPSFSLKGSITCSFSWASRSLSLALRQWKSLVAVWSVVQGLCSLLVAAVVGDVFGFDSRSCEPATQGQLLSSEPPWLREHPKWKIRGL